MSCKGWEVAEFWIKKSLCIILLCCNLFLNDDDDDDDDDDDERSCLKSPFLVELPRLQGASPKSSAYVEDKF